MNIRGAIKTGAPIAPAWVSVILAAREWGKYPWDIAGDGKRLLWWNRWKAYARAEARAHQDKVDSIGK